MDEEKCGTCVWIASEMDEFMLAYCWILHMKVYTGSMPCKHYEPNDDKHKPF